MALAATVEWDVRTTGNNANGGGFDPAAVGGTDYSLQDAAQITYTDLVIGGTNTQLTSAANPFVAAHVGNIVNVTGGTGFTIGRYQVISVAGAVATMDRAVGTAASTGGAGKLGGAMQTIAAAIAAAGGNTASGTVAAIVHIKAGTYTQTVAIPVAIVNVRLIVWGYQTTHRDGATKPLITTATNSVNLFEVNSSYVIRFRNLSLSNTATTRAIGIAAVGGTYPAVFVEDCLFDGFSYHIKGDNSGNTATTGSLVRSEFKNATANGCWFWWDVHVDSCYFHHNAGDAVKKTSEQNQILRVENSIFHANGRGVVGVVNILHIVLERNTFSAHTGDAVNLSTHSWLALANNIFFGNGGKGVNLNATGNNVQIVVNRNNAYGANSGGDRDASLAAGIGDVTLTASPFTSAGAGDFTLNAAAGGGARCTDAGLEWG